MSAPSYYHGSIVRFGELGHVIFTYRVSKKLSQRQLAELVSVSEGHISYIESGTRVPSMALLDRIFGVLGLKLYVKNGSGHP